MPKVRRPRRITRVDRRAAPKTRRQALYQKIDDCAKPTMMPPHILWCRDDGEAEQWLRHETLPWWFLASFINFCFRVHYGHYLRGKTHGSRHKRLLARLRRHPMRDDELIEEMERYHRTYAQAGKIEYGLIDMYDLELNDAPEITILCAQEELYRLLFTAEEREAHRLPVEYPGPHPPPSIPFITPPILLAETKQAFDALDATLPNNDMMAVSKDESFSYSAQDGMEGVRMTRSNMLSDWSESPRRDLINPWMISVPLSSAAKVPGKFSLPVRSGSSLVNNITGFRERRELSTALENLGATGRLRLAHNVMFNPPFYPHYHDGDPDGEGGVKLERSMDRE